MDSASVFLLCMQMHVELGAPLNHLNKISGIQLTYIDTSMFPKEIMTREFVTIKL